MTRNRNANPDIPQPRKLRERKPKRKISWRDIDSSYLHGFITAVVEDGSAVMLGRTLDEATLTVLVLAGNEKYRKYISNLADVEDELDDILWDLNLTNPTLDDPTVTR